VTRLPLLQLGVIADSNLRYLDIVVGSLPSPGGYLV
jgi:hypothetical protein